MDLIQEYSSQVSRQAAIRAELRSAPRGYISYKHIGGNTYAYLQRRVGKGISSQFIQAEQLERVSSGIARRKELELEQKQISRRIAELEKAGSLLSPATARKLRRIKLSAGMDTLPRQQKEKSLTFSQAMTYIEGIPVSEKTAEKMAAWKDGRMSFSQLLEDTLTRYGFPVED